MAETIFLLELTTQCWNFFWKNPSSLSLSQFYTILCAFWRSAFGRRTWSHFVRYRFHIHPSLAISHFFSKTKIQKVESIQQTLIIGIMQKITAYVRFIDKLFKAEFTGQILESHFYSLMHLKQSWVVKIFYTIKKSDSVIDICS